MLSFGKWGEKIIVGVGLVLVVGMAMGTGSFRNISWDKLKESHWRMVTGKTANEVKVEAAKKSTPPVEEAVMAEQEPQEEQAVAVTAPKSDKVKVVLYYLDADGEKLEAVTKKITMKEGIARAALEELVKGPGESKKLQSPIPEGTKVNDINIEDGLCTVDFSKELRDNHWGGSTGEMLTVYSIVDVLTQFPTVEKVQILIDGQKVDTLVGHMDLSKPLERNEDVLAKK